MDYEKGDLPFFPVADLRDENGCGIMEGSPGISLRDWFAGQALSGLAASPMDMPAEAYSLTAYYIADAMLAERSKP